MIELINIRKEYETITPIKCLSTTINRGDIISVIGPSGTGKSTLLRMINMLERPTSGQILVDGKDITVPGYPLHEVRKKIGMVFQNFNLFNHMTVMENVVDGPVHILHKDPQEAENRAMELLRKVGMADFADSHPADLSGGQKQRAAIARTLAMDPEVILFDEPTSALDPTMVGEVETVIKSLANDGYTMMLVTHDMEFAETVANRVFYLDEGGIYEDGTPEQVFRNPLREKTKAFVMRLKTLSCIVDKPTFDYMSFHTDVQAFVFKNEIPGEVAGKLRAISEELVAGIIIPFLQEGTIDGLSYEIKIMYSHKKKSVRIFLSWNKDIAETGNDKYTMMMNIIKYYADEITMTDDRTAEIKINESGEEK